MVLSTFAKNFHTVKISVLMLYTNDTMSEISGNVVMVEAVAVSFKDADWEGC